MGEDTAPTPSDNADLPDAIRAVTVGGAGTLAWRGPGGGINQTSVLPAGTYAINADRILATGTTATDLTGWV
ncbi:spike base protein, RCAP_Rcc01079 family [Paracoccus aminovorans]|uniref:spike base protein, RCAP_Rcc01079 family n=1 Tax=Paracoccus aminovorans TaxID=34004 RepID=UPI002B262B3B|nr:hypothetical protein [Paracoccus aminovorans]